MGTHMVAGRTKESSIRERYNEMAGTAAGGKKAAQTNKVRHGNDFYHKIGTKGGQNGKTGGFKSDTIGIDGLTGRERARIAGAKGGRNSKRGPNRVKTETQPSDSVLKSLNIDIENEAPRRFSDRLRGFRK